MNKILILFSLITFSLCANILSVIKKIEEEMPEKKDVLKIAKILSWNIWQMDGISMTVPYSKAKKEYVQSDLSAFLDDIELHIEEGPDEAMPAKIMDWKNGAVIEFQSLMKG